MSTHLVIRAWHSVMGILNVNHLIDNHFQKNGYLVGRTLLNYPHSNFASVSRTVVTDKSQELEINAIVSTRGFIIWKLTFQITELEDIDLSSLKVTIPELEIEKKSIFQVPVNLMYDLFKGMSILETYGASMLKNENFDDLLEYLGVEYLHDQIHLNLSHYLVTDSDEEFESLQNQFSTQSIDIVEGAHLTTTSPKEFPELGGAIRYGPDPIIYVSEKDQLITQVHEGLEHFHIGSNLMNQLYSQLNDDLYRLIRYIDEGSDISWLYVQNRLQDLELRYQRLKQELHSTLTDIYSFNGINYENPGFIDDLKLNYGLGRVRRDLNNVTTDIKEKIHLLNDLLSDKGEREEQEATNNLIQLIGILAIFEVISEFLPVLPEHLLFWIRVGFLFIIIPLLIWVWYRSRWINHKKRRIAEEIKRREELQYQLRNLKLFRIQLDRQAQASFGERLDDLFTRERENLEKSILVIEKELMDLN